MATKKNAVKPTVTKPKVFTKEESARMMDHHAFDEMLRFAQHILEREGLERAVEELESILSLAEQRKSDRGYATALFGAAHGHWKQWNRDNPAG